MSLLGLLPIIQLVCGASSWRCDHFAISGGIFFGDDFDGGEVRRKAGAGQLVGLFGLVALGHEDEAVAGGQFGQGFGNAGEQLDLLLGDGAGKAENPLHLFFSNWRGAEAVKAFNQRAREAGKAVAVGEDGFALDGVESLADLGGGVLVVVE